MPRAAWPGRDGGSGAGRERIIYGSDVTGRSFASHLGKVHGARISDEEKALIFSKNLHRLMRPILEAKGIQVE